MNKKKYNLLLVFIKNPEKGKVKTRLAQTVGEHKALSIYRKLLRHTVKTAQKVQTARQIWYSEYIDYEDGIRETDFTKCLQKGRNLGERMKNAFVRGFNGGYRNIVIIGSDCPDITPLLIERAFRELENHQIVIGPSEDGGYYLLGMNQYFPGLFSGVSWSTNRVLQQTLKIIESDKLSNTMLPVLNDIDTKDDLKKSNLI